MRRYLLGYLAAYLASLAAFGGMTLIGFYNWFMSDSPLWFDVLWVVVSCLPLLALGDVFGRRPKAKLVERPWRGLVVLLAVMGLLGLAGGLVEDLQMLSWIGMALGSALTKLAGKGSYWDGGFLLLGNLLLPLLYHLGWKWGTSAP